MKLCIRLFIVAFFVVPGIYFVAGRLTDIQASGKNFFTSTSRVNPKENTPTGHAETTLRVLTANCGQCHQSTLPTANPKALVIFDLDKKPWYTSVSDKHLESISRRISTKGGLSDTDRAAILEFIACIRKGNCKGV